MKRFNLEEYLANPNKKIVTGNGKKVTKILCTDAKGHFPVAVLVESFDGVDEQAISYTKDGHRFITEEHFSDLFFAPEKHEGYVNIYSYFKNNIFSDTCIYNSKEEAEEIGKKSPYYITTVKIEWEE